MRVLVINSGSSSIKFQIADVCEGESNQDLTLGPILLRGSVKGIGATGTLTLGAGGTVRKTLTQPVSNHSMALQWIFEHLKQCEDERGNALSLSDVKAVGHRVVHGGDRFAQPVVIDDAVEAEIDALSELAPLHNPVCLEGIRGARSILGAHVPMVAVFDTAFHQTMPVKAKTYALPLALASRHHISRYGFHGIAHASLADGYAAFVGKPLSETRIITLQLGNGCSVTAIAGGKSVDTSMGFTPLEGLVMGTRSGDVDPSIVSYLSEREQVEASEVERLLNEQSGLLGMSGKTHDMRELLHAAIQEHDEQAQLAIDVFCYRAKKYIGAYLAVLGGADAIIFGGGIGEGSPDIRERICEGMGWCGLQVDPERNHAAVGLQPGCVAKISTEHSSLNVYVIATDEETWIAQETMRCLRAPR